MLSKAMGNIEERLRKIEPTIRSPRFRANQGLGYEVGYYIFDYDAKDELVVREHIAYLKAKYQNGKKDFQIVVFDIYDLIMDMLEEEGFIDLCESFEKKRGIDEITKAINEMLRMEEDNADNELLAYIEQNTPPNSIVFLTGVGKCYPLLRSHKILNNLHQYIDKMPVIMFYPGKYSEQSLMMFGEIKDDNYYRAFRLVD